MIYDLGEIARRLARRPLIAVFGLVLGAGLGADAAADSAVPSLTSEQWRQDLAQLVATIEQVHPDPYTRVERVRFASEVARLDREIPELSPLQVTVRLMQLVALLEDGHTSLEPGAQAGFGSWFAVRLHRFTDGIFITAVSKEHAELAGARVERIGSMPVAGAWDLAGSLLGADNELGAMQRAPLYLSNAAALSALGVIDDASALQLVVRRGAAEAETVRLEAIDAGFDLEFQFWGEMWGPASEAVDYVTAFDGRPSESFYDSESDLPLHLRARYAHWFTYLEQPRLLYAQINYMGDGRRGSFDEFQRKLWKVVDGAAVELLVLDCRYNIGGDGSLVRDFVHEVIKRDRINQAGKLFTVVGRATFSAGVMLVAAMDQHTETVFVGEPMGAYYQHYGDGTSFVLQNSGLEVWVSTIYHQLDAYVGDDRLLPIQLPAPFSAADYFGGRDPALERILATRQRPTLARLFRDGDAESALAEYEMRRREFGDVAWWAPFTMGELNSLGNELREAGRIEDAMAAYRLNAQRHPDHWRVWYSLGRAQREQGRIQQAIEHYSRALEIDPYNNLAPVQREALAELRAAQAVVPPD